MPNKNIFRKKYGVTGLVFKIYTIDGKKWVKFERYSGELPYPIGVGKIVT